MSSPFLKTTFVLAFLAAAMVLGAWALLARHDASATGATLLLIIDEDSIDNGTSTIEGISFGPPNCGSGDPAVCVNDDIPRDAGGGLTTPLFSRGTDITPFSGLLLPTGQLQDEGLFFVGLTGADREAFIRDTLPNSQIDPIPGTPLREAEIRALVGQTVCAKVKDSDVSDLGGGQLNAQGDYKGLTAFTVTEVLNPGSLPESGSSSSLPDIRIDLLPSSDVLQTCLSQQKATPTDTPPDDPTKTPPATKTPPPTKTLPPTNTPPTRTPVEGVTATPIRNIPGDVNCDGKVTSRDALLILQFNVGLKNVLGCQKNADVNCDFIINAVDAALILQFEVGLLDALPHCLFSRVSPETAEVLHDLAARSLRNVTW